MPHGCRLGSWDTDMMSWKQICNSEARSVSLLSGQRPCSKIHVPDTRSVFLMPEARLQVLQIWPQGHPSGHGIKIWSQKHRSGLKDIGLQGHKSSLIWANLASEQHISPKTHKSCLRPASMASGMKIWSQRPRAGLRVMKLT